MEQVEAEQSQALEQATEQTRKLELQIAALRVEAEHAATLEKELQRLRAAATDARTEAQRWRQEAEHHRLSKRS